MTLRVFAYGGSSFNVQRRIGEWATLPASFLEDPQGLYGGLPSFGFGVLADQQPFLIWRVLQNLENRGGYPFTLLLDPGEEVYERFQWNTGRLLAALFEDGDRVGRVLLEQSPSIKAADVAQMIASLPLSATVGPNSDDARLYWTAGALADGVLAVTPARLSLAQRPTAAQVGAWQHRLPIGLRNSGGWFVSGDATHAASIGAHLAVVDRTDVEASVTDARPVLAAVDRAHDLDPWARSLVERWLQMQTWRNRDGLRRALQGVNVLDAPEGLSAFAATLDDESERRQWTQGACTALVKDTRQQGPAVTRFVLDQALAGICQLNVRYHRLLDRATRDQFLDEQRIPPEPPPASLGLPGELQVERWTALIARAGLRAPDQVGLAFEQLGKVSTTEQHTLIAAGWQAAAKGPLEAWRPLMDRPEVKQLTRDEARRRARDGTIPFAPAEYEEFADDASWDDLHQTVGSSAAGMRRITTARLSVDRLRRLAQWEERRLLSPADRAKIAGVANGAWAALVTLDRLLNGDQIAGIQRADAETAAILREDVLPAVAALGAGSPPPNLAGLRALLGELPRDALDALAARETERQRTELERILIGDDALPSPDALRKAFAGDQLTLTVARWQSSTPDALNRMVRRFAGSTPHLAVLLDNLDDEQQHAVAMVVWEQPLPLRALRRAVETIRQAGPAGIILARAALLESAPSTKRSWWSRLWRK